MSIGPTGITGSVAGSPLSQSSGSDIDRAKQESSDRAREVQADQKAESAGGIGETEQDEGASERDADGRRLWEQNSRVEEESEESTDPDDKGSRDSTGEKGQQIDLTG